MRIHLGDWVTCSESNHAHLGFLNVVGAKRLRELSEVEGLWVLKDWQSGKEFDMLGCFITVWKPVLPPLKNLEAANTATNTASTKAG